MADKVLTAPLAILKVNGVAVGRAKNISCTESIRRQPVVGIGRLAPTELAAVGWSGTVNMGFFTIDLRQSPIPGALNRVAQSVEQWENMLTLDEDGVQLDLMRKVKRSTLPTGIVTIGYEVFASIKGCFITRESWDITEQQISGRNQDFEYINPILFPL